MKIKLTNEAHKSYARTDDACEAFKRAVGNGQARLALEMMVDIVDYIASLSDDTSNDDVITAKEAVQQVEQKEPVKTTAKKQVAAKTTQKNQEEAKEEE